MFRILQTEQLAPTITRFVIEAPYVARKRKAGNFVIVRVDEHGERIPLTIADFDRKKGTITLVIQAVGKTTREMQQDCKVGDSLYAVTGPMGIPSHIDKVKKVACVGGGLGVAPIFPHARAFKEAGAYVIGIVGFRNKKLMFWEDKFKNYCDEFIVCTDDGSAGIKGMITEGIKQAIAKHPDIDELVAIGPPIMMRGCAEATRPHNIKTIVSLNPLMVDGTGMCGGCRVIVDGQSRFACVDGPVFDAHLVDFDLAIRRNKAYVEQEKAAAERQACATAEVG